MYAAVQGMFKVVVLQVATALIGIVLATMIFGSRGALSAALGGVACILPTWLFAIRLHAVSKRPGASYAVAFFLGELIKIALCIGLLAAVRLVYPEVHWGALVIGLVVTLQANFFAFLVKT
jgi:ATP synthase protein I